MHVFSITLCLHFPLQPYASLPNNLWEQSNVDISIH